MEHEDPWQRLEAAAELVGRSPGTLRRWVRAGHVRTMAGPIAPTGGRPPSLVDMVQVRSMAEGGSRRVAEDPARLAWELARTRDDLGAASQELLRVRAAQAAASGSARDREGELRGLVADLRVELAAARAEREGLSVALAAALEREERERAGREDLVAALIRREGRASGTDA